MVQRNPAPEKSSPLLQKKCAVKVLRTPTPWKGYMRARTGIQKREKTYIQRVSVSVGYSRTNLYIFFECYANRVYFWFRRCAACSALGKFRSTSLDHQRRICLRSWPSTEKFVGGLRSLRRRRKLASREGKDINISNLHSICGHQ